MTTNLIKKAEEGVNGLMAKLGAPADLSQHSPHASVQQLLHVTKSLTELQSGSALGNLQVNMYPLLILCRELKRQMLFMFDSTLLLWASCAQDCWDHGCRLHQKKAVGCSCLPCPK